MRGLLFILAAILLVAGLWYLNAKLPERPQRGAAENGNQQPDDGRPTRGNPERENPTADNPGSTDTGKNTQGTDLPGSHAPGAGPGDVVRIQEVWPQPDVALMISGEQHGYFEPCGCTANQMGGMARRADLRKQLTDAGWTVRGIELGGLARRTGRQAQIKFETSLRALRDLQYVAVGLGPEDLRLQPDFLLSQDIPEDGNEALRFVSANLVFYDDPDLETPKPWRIVELNGHRIGITSVMSESTESDVFPEGVNSGVTWSAPEPALTKVLDEFESQQVNYRVLLSHATPDETRALLKTFPQFDAVVVAQGFSDPNPKAAPDLVGDTLFLQVGHKGKYVGVLGLYPDDAEARVRFQLMPLERSEFEDAPEMIVHMKEYQQQLIDEQIVLNDGEIGHPSGASFVGAAKCGECHTTAFDIWEKTPHAHAFESLDPANERTGFERLNGVARMHDPECLSCHVTGWNAQEYIRYRTGFLNTEFAQSEKEQSLQSLLAGNQCENCHGPGSRHVELIEGGLDEDLDQARKEVRMTLEQAKDACYDCHDTDNSPKFKFDEYWPKVEHHGLD